MAEPFSHDWLPALPEQPCCTPEAAHRVFRCFQVALIPFPLFGSQVLQVGYRRARAAQQNPVEDLQTKPAEWGHVRTGGLGMPLCRHRTQQHPVVGALQLHVLRARRGSSKITLAGLFRRQVRPTENSQVWLVTVGCLLGLALGALCICTSGIPFSHTLALGIEGRAPPDKTQSRIYKQNLLSGDMCALAV